MDAQVESELVEAAQAGDEQALDQLLRRYLPLVYNVVGSALHGHADVDDVVQETMVRATAALPTLRDTTRFRSWIITIAVRQVQARSRARARRISRESSLERYGDQAAPESDFVDLTVLELGLSGQRREVVEATRWLSPEDRQLLTLWWQEAAGELTRTELAEAAGFDRKHVAVRIQRMKDRLELARIVQRVLTSGRGCPRLTAMLRKGGASPGDRELNRLARHVRRCEDCRATGRGMVPPERLLAGIALLPVPDALAHGLSGWLGGVLGAAHSGVTSLLTATTGAATQHAGLPATAKAAASLKPVLATGAVATGAALAITLSVQYLPYDESPPPAPPTPVAPGRSASPTADDDPAQDTEAPGSGTRRYRGYVMAYFTETPDGAGSDYGLHLAVSGDGLDWMPLNQNAPVLTPTRGSRGLRDPFLLRRQDGTFVVLATDLSGTDFSRQNQHVHVWTSPDLRTFTHRRLRLHSLPTHTWAPEAFYDPAGKRYGIVYSVTRDGRESIFVNYTEDFETVDEPLLFFDPGFDVLDPTIVSEGGTHHLYFTEGRTGRIRAARSTTLAPRSFERDVRPGGLVQGDAVRGPMVVTEIGGPRRWLWGDSYRPVNGELYVWQTTRLGDPAAWAPLDVAAYAQPLNAKQGSVLPITAAERSRLVDRWGAPSWNRIRPANYPDHLVRHQRNVARIDPYPFDPYPDSQWRLVPGLADRAGVSFRSVNYPDRYLRDTGDGVVLAEDDGSPGFRSAATFVRVPGLADRDLASFRSHADPARYLRHVEFLLRVDPIRSEADRRDATFDVGY